VLSGARILNLNHVPAFWRYLPVKLSTVVIDPRIWNDLPADMMLLRWVLKNVEQEAQLLLW